MKVLTYKEYIALEVIRRKYAMLKSEMKGDTWVTYHDDQKLTGFQSLSTACKYNKYCIARIKKGLMELKNKPDAKMMICVKCYADRQLAFKKGLLNHLESNEEVLNSPMTEDQIKLVVFDTDCVRIESFGDTGSVLQCINIIKIINNNPNVFFGIWSKNKGLWKQAFDAFGKPVNCNYIHSSLYVDYEDEIDTEKYWFIDAIFTVYSTETKVDEAVANGSVRCAGIRCRLCMRCYTKMSGKLIHIAELGR